MTSAPFDVRYYAATGLDRDRIALRWYARVLRRLGRPGSQLFELGCGAGHLLAHLTPHFSVTGYDLSEVARQRAAKNAPLAVILDNWLTLPPSSFDLAVSLHTLEHLPEPDAAIERIGALLRPGGTFLFVVPHTGGWGRRLKRERWFAYRDPTHCSLLSRGDWEKLVRRAGLTVVSVRGDGLWDAPYVPLLPAALQRVMFGAPAALQVFSPLARPFLPAVMGECLIITAEKPRGSR
jgi:SAM-dependent methyltransferase